MHFLRRAQEVTRCRNTRCREITYIVRKSGAEFTNWRRGMAVDNARACLRELVKHVFERRDGPTDGLGLAYSDLSARIGRMNKHGKGNPRGMGPLLDKIGHLLQDLEGKWGEPIPQIQSLVVQKTGTESGLPSNGI